MFKQLTKETWNFAISRDLRVGPPNTGKSHSVLTNERPVHVIVYPGEKGVTTYPSDREWLKVWHWEEDDITRNKPGAIITEVETLTTEIIAGKHGPVGSFTGDGLHKLYSHFWLREYNRLLVSQASLLDAGKVTEDDLKLRAYGNENYGASKEFMAYVTKVYHSSLPHVTFLCWEGAELDVPELKSKSSSHIFPDFPGKLAKRIMGEFAVVLYAIATQPDPLGNIKFKWQIKPGGKVWGAGVKVPADIAKNIPREMAQDWAILKPVLLGEVVIGAPKTGGLSIPKAVANK